MGIFTNSSLFTNNFRTKMYEKILKNVRATQNHTPPPKKKITLGEQVFRMAHLALLKDLATCVLIFRKCHICLLSDTRP